MSKPIQVDGRIAVIGHGLYSLRLTLNKTVFESRTFYRTEGEAMKVLDKLVTRGADNEATTTTPDSTTGTTNSSRIYGAP